VGDNLTVGELREDSTAPAAFNFLLKHRVSGDIRN
jgi:hypothetical protein